MKDIRSRELVIVLLTAFIARAIAMYFSDNFPGSVIFRFENSSRYLLGLRSPLEGTHLPLFNFLLLPLLKFIPSYAITASRLIVYLFSCLALIQYFRMIKLLFPTFIALCSLIILSFYPLDLYHSLVPTENSLFLLLSYSLLFYSARLYLSKNVYDYYKTVIILTIGVCCRYEFWFFTILIFPTLIEPPLKKQHLLLLLPIIFITSWTIFSSGAYSRITTNLNTYEIPPGYLDRLTLWPKAFYKSIGIIVLPLIFMGTFFTFKRFPKYVFFVVAYILFLISSALLGRVEFNNRYMILPLSLIFPIILSSMSFFKLPHRIAPFLIFCITFYHAYYSFSRYDIIRPKQYEIRTMIKYFEKNSSHEKACNIFFDESGGSFLFHHYFLAHNCIQYIDRYIFISSTKEKFVRIYNDLMAPLLTKKFEYIMTRNPDDSSFFSEMKTPSGNILIGKDLQYRPVHQFHSHLLYRRIPQDRED